MHVVYKQSLLEQFRIMVQDAEKRGRAVDYVEVTHEEFRRLEAEVNPHLIPLEPGKDLKDIELQIYGTRVKVLPVFKVTEKKPVSPQPCHCSGMGACFNCR